MWAILYRSAVAALHLSNFPAVSSSGDNICTHAHSDCGCRKVDSMLRSVLWRTELSSLYLPLCLVSFWQCAFSLFFSTPSSPPILLTRHLTPAKSCHTSGNDATASAECKLILYREQKVKNRDRETDGQQQKNTERARLVRSRTKQNQDQKDVEGGMKRCVSYRERHTHTRRTH